MRILALGDFFSNIWRLVHVLRYGIQTLVG